MSCCCHPGRSNKSSASCLGRCGLPKHRCLVKDDVKPGPVPKFMGWLYTAKDSPKHQLRCGWRPGHIACPVLKKIEQHNCRKTCECASPCPSTSTRPVCSRLCCAQPKCITVCPSVNSSCKQPQGPQPQIRIIRHGGQYKISTKPSNVSNAPSGPYPLKYVLNTDEDAATEGKYSVEAKFNDYHFDYTSSKSSFILDFSPPEQKCYKPCPKKNVTPGKKEPEKKEPGTKEPVTKEPVAKEPEKKEPEKKEPEKKEPEKKEPGKKEPQK